jgi:hypothetical protein
MLIYPVFAITAVMALAGGRVEPLMRTFLGTCLFYPLIYLSSWFVAVTLQRHRKRVAAFVVSGVPLQYIGLAAMLALVTLLREGMLP